MSKHQDRVFMIHTVIAGRDDVILLETFHDEVDQLSFEYSPRDSMFTLWPAVAVDAFESGFEVFGKGRKGGILLAVKHMLFDGLLN